MKLAAVFGLLAALSATAADERAVTWSDLPALIVGKDVVIGLTAGSTLEGRARSVSAAELRVNVVRSTDDRFRARGEHGIARTSIERLFVVERGVAGPIIGLVGGFVGGFFLGGAIFDKPGEITATLGKAAASGAAGSIGGFWLGRRLDKRRTLIRLMSDPVPE